MKKLLLPLLSILLLTDCKKEVTTITPQEEIASATANKQTKLFVCHYDAVTGTSKTIEVDQSALVGHLAHGDVQGECIQTTTICNQVWMVKNLDVTTYRNGDIIPQVTDQAEWNALTTGAWCYYENNSANGPVYGKLYNWYAANDPRGLAPTGWHVPTSDEWAIVSDCLGGDFVAGGKMKSVGTIEAGTGLWHDPNTDATNSSGFTGLPGGLRLVDAGFGFERIGNYGLWWTSTAHPIENNFIFYRMLFRDPPFILQGYMFKEAGLSVRCVKDN